MKVKDAIASTSRAIRPSDHKPCFSSQINESSVFSSLVESGVPKGLDEGCAIVIDVEKDIPAEVYAESVANEIGPSALLYTGLRSGKLVIYLRSSSFAEQVAVSGIGVNGRLVKVKQSSAPVKRVLLSNVNPGVPNSVLMTCLAKYGKVSGEIKMLSTGFKNNLSHVKSLRRVCGMILNEEYNNNLNDSFNVITKILPIVFLFPLKDLFVLSVVKKNIMFVTALK